MIVLVRKIKCLTIASHTGIYLDMDCDGLKKSLLTDTDGTLFGQPSSLFSQAEYLWGIFLSFVTNFS